MFLIVFALQEGQSGGWAPWIWAVLVAGVGFMTGFIYWQSVNTQEPLVPLDIFRDRDFSLSNVGVAVIGFAVTAMILPLMFYAQAVCGLSPTRSALLTAPMAITSGFLAPVVGKIVDRAHPLPVVGFGFSMLAIGLTWLSIAMTASAPIWELVLPFIAIGRRDGVHLGAAGCHRDTQPADCGWPAPAPVCTTRPVRSAPCWAAPGMASFMTSRISSKLPPLPEGPAFGPQGGKGAALQLPEFLREPFAAAMSQSMLLPAFVALFGVAAALFMVGFGGSAGGDDRGARDAAADSTDNPGVPTRRVRVRPSAAEGFGGVDGAVDGLREGFDDDDDYVEYTLSPAPAASPRPPRAVVRPAARGYANEDRTEPLAVRTEHPRPAPAENWHSAPAESWHSLLDDADPATDVEPIGFAHNGFHVDDEQRFRPVEEFLPRNHGRVDDDEPFFDDIDTYGGASDRASRSRNARPGGELRNGYHRPSGNRHHRNDLDQGPGHGRHSSPDS